MSSKSFLLSIGVALVAASGASAATFDFAKVADDYWALAAGPDGKRAEGTFAQVAASAAGAGLSDGGVMVVGATGSHLTKSAHVFFDYDSGSGPAGLGVCSTGILANGVSQCSSGDWGAEQVTSDDNITESETLDVTFSTDVSLVDMSFRDALHNLATGTLIINGTEYLIENGGLSSASLGMIGSGRTFTFAYGGASPTQAYLTASTVAPVPLPAGALLLLGALGGLFGLRRLRAA